MKRPTKDELAHLHYLAVRAAMRYDAATPGTRTRDLREASWDRAEKRFSEALSKLYGEEPMPDPNKAYPLNRLKAE